MSGFVETLASLGVALTLGLLVGLERGWQERSAPEGRRVAGIRTFGLIALLGGLSEVLARAAGEILLGIVFFALVVLMAIAHVAEASESKDYGVTTLIAALITFVLGALAVRGEQQVVGLRRQGHIAAHARAGLHGHDGRLAPALHEPLIEGDGVVAEALELLLHAGGELGDLAFQLALLLDDDGLLGVRFHGTHAQGIEMGVHDEGTALARRRGFQVLEGFEIVEGLGAVQAAP